MVRRLLVGVVSASCLAASCLSAGTAMAGERSGDDWHGPGWHGTAWGTSDWEFAFRRDSVVGVYGRYGTDGSPYASYRNDNGCYRMLPVDTPRGVRLRRVFVCDF